MIKCRILLEQREVAEGPGGSSQAIPYPSLQPGPPSCTPVSCHGACIQSSFSPGSPGRSWERCGVDKVGLCRHHVNHSCNHSGSWVWTGVWAWMAPGMGMIPSCPAPGMGMTPSFPALCTQRCFAWPACDHLPECATVQGGTFTGHQPVLLWFPGR